MDSFSFQWQLKTKVVFGWGELRNIGGYARELGNHALLVTGRSSLRRSGKLDEIVGYLATEKVKCTVFEGVEPNPMTSTIARGSERARVKGCDFILAVGGGSVMDASKAIALELTTGEPVWGYTIFQDDKKVTPALTIPVMLVPTLNATGSELNGNAVLTNEELCEKSPISDPKLAPDIALIDPSLTVTLPWKQTAYTIMDATSHILEPYFSAKNVVPVSDSITEGVLQSIVECGKVLKQNPQDQGAICTLAWAGSVACCNLPSLGMGGSRYCHHVEHVLSAFTDITHALGLAIIVPRWMHWFKDRIGGRLMSLAPIYACNGTIAETPDEVINEFQQWLATLGLQTNLTEQGITDRSLSEKMAASFMSMERLKTSYDNSVCAISEDELKAFYDTCFE